VFYSVFGIKSKKRDIVLVNAVFRENGQFNFTINDNIMMVDEKISYSYNAPDSDKTDSAAVIISEKEKYLASLSPKQKKLRTTSLMTLISGGVGVIGTGVLFGFSGKYNELYNQENTDISKLHGYKDKYFTFRNAGIGTAAGSGAVLISSLITYVLYKKNLNETPVTQIKVSIGNWQKNKRKLNVKLTWEM